MFEPLADLPAVLAAYFHALNDGDYALASSYFTDDAEVIVDGTANGDVHVRTPSEIERWLERAMSFRSVAAAPVAVTVDGPSIRVQVAVTAIEESGRAIRLLQQADYRLEGDRIAAVHTHVPRRRREVVPPPE